MTGHQTGTPSELPLSGRVVIEIGHSVAAPYAGLVLAELGAEAPAKTVKVVSFSNPPVRDVQVEMLEGEPEEQAAALVERLLEEKVL